MFALNTSLTLGNFISIKSDGKIEFLAGFTTTDEASLKFWDALKQMGWEPKSFAKEWLPISEAPKDGTFIDAYNSRNGERCVSRWKDHGVSHSQGAGWTGFDYQWGNEPTHFQFLPKPPTE